MKAAAVAATICGAVWYVCASLILDQWNPLHWDTGTVFTGAALVLLAAGVAISGEIL